MNLAISTNIRDGATPALQAILESFSQQRLQNVAGPAAVQRVQMHLRTLPANKLGGARTNYYSDQARATHWEAASEGVTISIGEANKGMALHYFGGDLGPENLKNAANFAIPARAEAHGKVPSDFEGELEVLWGRNGPYALARHLAAPRAKKRGEGTVKDLTPGEGLGEVLFWLTKHVHIEPDPTVIPTDEDIAFAVIGAIFADWRSRQPKSPGGVN